MTRARDPGEKRYRFQLLRDGKWQNWGSLYGTSAEEALQHAARLIGVPRERLRLEPGR